MGIAVPSTIWLDQSGPGLLVSWRLNSSLNQSEDILQYVVLRARWPSPSFYELQSACCPMTPSQSRPCCPVQASRTSLQVEGLEDGVPFRFKIIAMLRDHQNETIGPSQPLTTAVRPGIPASPSIAWQGIAVARLYWSPVHNGGIPIQGYSIWATLPGSGFAPRRLLDNTSSAAVVWAGLVLLPARRYTLALQAHNAVGASAVGAFCDAFETAAAPQAEYELPINAWVGGSVEYGGIRRHRFFLPTVSRKATVRLQTSSGPLSARQLHLYLDLGAEPPLPQQLRAGWCCSSTLLSNASAWEGALVIALPQARSGWYYLLVHAAAAHTLRATYDVRIEADVVGSSAVSSIAERWRYYVDPDQPTSFHPYTVSNFLDPQGYQR